MAYNSAGSAITNVGSFENGSGDHEVFLQTADGYGSTNTTIKKWTTAQRNVGTAIIYLTSAADGASFTCFEPCQVSIHYTEQYNTVVTFGISRNSNQLTTTYVNITAAHRTQGTTTSASGVASQCSVTLNLNIGDVLRCHTEGTAANGANTAVDSVRITKNKNLAA